MTDKIEQLKREVTEARQYLDAVLNRVGSRWETPVYSEGAQWNVRQLVIHLALADQGINNQVVSISEGREAIPADFDLNRYNQRSVEKRATMTVEEARASLNMSRATLLGWLENADEEKLAKTGRHASLKILSVEEIVRGAADHDRGHATDIASVLNITLESE